MRTIQWVQLVLSIVFIAVITALVVQTNDPTSMKIGKIGAVASIQALLFAIPFVSARSSRTQKGIKS